MESYLWIIWVKLAGALWIIGGKLGSSLIFYFVAIEENCNLVPRVPVFKGSGARGGTLANSDCQVTK
jgi:hypothetical protein